MFIHPSLQHALIALVAILLTTSILHAQSNEFHYGYGGISIRAGGQPDSVRLAEGNVAGYTLSGYWFEWESDAYDIRLLVSSVYSGRTWTGDPAIDVVPIWKTEFLKQLGPKVVARESPLAVRGSKGFEIRAIGERTGLTRVFSMNGQLIAATIYTDKAEDVDRYRGVLDSLRPLTQVERTVAMIEEFAPPGLSQDRLKGLSVPDTTELGLIGAVRMVRDTTPGTAKTESRVIEEVHFDKNGFKTREIVFNQNYPDVITSWGWDEGKRVNIQSAVNYPPGDGPVGGRSTIVTGSLAIPGLGTFVNKGPKYGNRIDTEFDSLNRPSGRRRFSNTGDLTLVEHFKYAGRTREIRTVDASGGFIGAVRETLDANSNIVETQTLTNDGKVFESTRFEYEFDSKGNWIVRKAFRKGPVGRAAVKPTSIVNRTVRYYDEEDRGIG